MISRSTNLDWTTNITYMRIRVKKMLSFFFLNRTQYRQLVQLERRKRNWILTSSRQRQMIVAKRYHTHQFKSTESLIQFSLTIWLNNARSSRTHFDLHNTHCHNINQFHRNEWSLICTCACICAWDAEMIVDFNILTHWHFRSLESWVFRLLCGSKENAPGKIQWMANDYHLFFGFECCFFLSTGMIASVWYRFWALSVSETVHCSLYTVRCSFLCLPHTYVNCKGSVNISYSRCTLYSCFPVDLRMGEWYE